LREALDRKLRRSNASALCRLRFKSQLPDDFQAITQFFGFEGK
jgi:hypothetical protein